MSLCVIPGQACIVVPCHLTILSPEAASHHSLQHCLDDCLVSGIHSWGPASPLAWPLQIKVGHVVARLTMLRLCWDWQGNVVAHPQMCNRHHYPLGVHLNDKHLTMSSDNKKHLMEVLSSLVCPKNQNCCQNVAPGASKQWQRNPNTATWHTQAMHGEFINKICLTFACENNNHICFHQTQRPKAVQPLLLWLSSSFCNARPLLTAQFGTLAVVCSSFSILSCHVKCHFLALQSVIFQLRPPFWNAEWIQWMFCQNLSPPLTAPVCASQLTQPHLPNPHFVWLKPSCVTKKSHSMWLNGKKLNSVWFKLVPGKSPPLAWLVLMLLVEPFCVMQCHFQ